VPDPICESLSGPENSLSGALTAASPLPHGRSGPHDPAATVRIVARISDAVAIVSVVTSGVVGVGGLLSASLGARWQRRWQSREERVAELRTVLDAGAGHIGAAMQAISQANEALRGILFEPDQEDQLLERARGHLADAMIAQNGIWSTSNQLRLRKGPESPVAVALDNAEHEVGMLGAVVRRKMVRPDALGYDDAWEKARLAERDFYAAAEVELRAAVPGKSSSG
jgi:hypothetical protein